MIHFKNFYLPLDVNSNIGIPNNIFKTISMHGRPAMYFSFIIPQFKVIVTGGIYFNVE
jgi:hypothetical protein